MLAYVPNVHQNLHIVMHLSKNDPTPHLLNLSEFESFVPLIGEGETQSDNIVESFGRYDMRSLMVEPLLSFYQINAFIGFIGLRNYVLVLKNQNVMVLRRRYLVDKCEIVNFLFM